MIAPRRVWVTRAEPGATRTAERVRALGLSPVVRPLLAVRFLDAALDLTGVAALAFTSRNGVEGFARLHPARDLPVHAVGDATAAAARTAGFGQVRSADGDLDALAALIRRTGVPRGGVVLIPGPSRPAGDLAAQVGPDIAVRSVVVYATEPTTDVSPLEFDIALVHSPRAAARLADCLAGRDLTAQFAVAISRATALPLERLGFSGLLVADRPDENAMMVALGKAIGRV